MIVDEQISLLQRHEYRCIVGKTLTAVIMMKDQLLQTVSSCYKTP